MDIVFFWIYLAVGVIILIIFYKLYLMIKSVNYRRLFKITNIIIMLLLAFFASIDGLKGNPYLNLFIIEFLLSIIIFIYSIVFIIKYKKFNYLFFTPFLLIISFFTGLSYGQMDERKIYKVADKIISYYQEENISKEEILNYINIPKNMEIIIENNDIVIKYKNMIYYPNKHTIEYIHNE